MHFTQSDLPRLPKPRVLPTMAASTHFRRIFRGMLLANIILFERGDAWRRALRICAPDLTPVVETRSLTECVAELRQARASVVGLELTPRDAAGIVDFLLEMRSAAPFAQAVVLAAHEIGSPEHVPISAADLRLAGAMHIIRRRRHMNVFAEIAERHLNRMQSVLRRARPDRNTCS